MYNFRVGSYSIMFFYLGNPPLILYSRLGRTYPNHGSIFSGFLRTNEEDGTLSCRFSVVDT